MSASLLLMVQLCPCSGPGAAQAEGRRARVGRAGECIVVHVANMDYRA